MPQAHVLAPHLRAVGMRMPHAPSLYDTEPCTLDASPLYVAWVLFYWLYVYLPGTCCSPMCLQCANSIRSNAVSWHAYAPIPLACVLWHMLHLWVVGMRMPEIP